MAKCIVLYPKINLSLPFTGNRGILNNKKDEILDELIIKEPVIIYANLPGCECCRGKEELIENLRQQIKTGAVQINHYLSLLCIHEAG